MTTHALKFYRQSAQPTEAVVGAIWFDVTNRTIQVKTNTGWEPYAGKIQDVTWNEKNQTLTISKHDGSSKSVNLSDVASASAIAVELNKKLNIGTSTDVAGTQSYYGLKADIAAAAESAQNAAKVKDVDTTATNGINLSLDADGKLDVTVTPGEVVQNNTGVVTGGVVYTAIDNAKTSLIGDIENNTDNDITIYGTRIYVDNQIAAINENITTINNNYDELSTTVAGNTAAINSILNNEDGTNYNSIAELASWIEEHGKEAADMVEAIEDNAENIKTISDDYLKSADKTELTGLITTAQNTANSAVKSVVEGDGNGQIKVDDTPVNVYGLKSAAFTESFEYATAEQGRKADSAVQSVELGQEVGYIKVDDREFSLGLGTAAFTESTAYATAAQGVTSAEGDTLVSASFASNKVSVNATEALTNAVALANLAVQSASGDDYVTASVTNKNVVVAATMQPMASASATYKGLAEASDVKSYVDNALCWVVFE